MLEVLWFTLPTAKQSQVFTVCTDTVLSYVTASIKIIAPHMNFYRCRGTADGESPIAKRLFIGSYIYNSICNPAIQLTN